MVLNCLSESKRGKHFFWWIIIIASWIDDASLRALQYWCSARGQFRIGYCSCRSLIGRFLNFLKFFQKFSKTFFLWKIITDLGSRMGDAIEELKGTWFDFYQVIWQRKNWCTTLRPVFLKKNIFLNFQKKIYLGSKWISKRDAAGLDWAHRV